MPVIKCKFCTKEFTKKASQIARSNNHYCSSDCGRKAQRTGKLVNCHVCGKEAYKQFRTLNRSKSKQYFCTKSCQTKWRNAFYSGSKHPNYKKGEYTYRTILKKTGIEEKCLLCATTDTRVLAVHHIDWDHSNNNPQNLAWLCHNCHFLVHHDNVECKHFAEIIARRNMVAMV